MDKLLLKTISLAILSVVVLVFFLGGVSLIYKKTFAVRYENIRRDVFKSTRSYHEGKIQDLARYRLQYIKAKTSEDREAIKSTIQIMFADYKTSELPDELKEFLNKVLN